MVSFHSEDEPTLTEEVLHRIEQHFAKALGYAGHQRHCGVHKNTAHLHMHIAYNMIHPEKLTRHEPYRDFVALSHACRELEREFGISVDRGMEPEQEQEPKRPNTKARVVEAHSGQQAFDRYVQEHRERLLADMATAKTWHDVHGTLAAYGLCIRLRANGCVVADRHSEKASHRVKASSVDRSFSKAALEQRFGPFEPAGELEVSETCRYTARPLQRGPERGQLYTLYRQVIEERKTRLAGIRERQDAEEKVIREHWATKRHEIRLAPLTRKDRLALLHTVACREREAIRSLRSKTEEERRAVRADVPFWDWNGFLRFQAEAGNETALAILRSKDVEVKPDCAEAVQTTQSDVSRPTAQRQVLKSDMQKLQNLWQQRRQDIQGQAALTWSDKKQLLAVARMRQLEAEDRAIGTRSAANFTWRVDARGVILFTLATGGQVRDDGRTLTFSAHDPNAKVVAERLAILAFGRGQKLEENRITRQRRTKRQAVEKGI